MTHGKSPRVHVRLNGHLECRHKLNVAARESSLLVCADCQRLVERMVSIICQMARAESEDERVPAFERAREFVQDFFSEEI